jgi:hypothetical protein
VAVGGFRFGADVDEDGVAEACLRFLRRDLGDSFLDVGEVGSET